MTGLTSQQVTEKTQANQTNVMPKPNARTGWDIVRENVFTYFNFLNTLIFLLVLTTGSWKNTLFMGVVISNICLGIGQEFYLRRKLKQLKAVTLHYHTVLRDGKEERILSDDIVLDDVVFLTAGEQIPCDMKILSTEYLEVNESLITGEADPVSKNQGDSLVSGSFVVAGSCYARAVKVGKDTYYASIIESAGTYQKMDSRILMAISKIIRVMSYIILPLGIILFLSTLYRDGSGWQEAIISTVASVIGMIPSGLYLITTITAGTAVMKLANKKALVNDFSAVECLSRVSTVCLDKTGTLTTGEIKLKELVSYDQNSYEYLRLFAKAFPVRNSTMEGIYQAYGDKTQCTWDSLVPFSSARKYSELKAGGHCYRLGAADRLVNSEEVLKTVSEKMAQGDRVLALTKDGECMALVVMSDVLKKDAQEVLDYFRTENVDLKIISGDHPETVSKIARQLGFRDYDRYVDLNTHPQTLECYQKLVKEYSIFGRVSPEEKRLLVQALKANGETVAMSGDGVNDVLALKEADLAIAMANGAQAAKAVAQVVLSESDFTPVPLILKEGRRIVNNIEQVANLYLLKTGFSLILSLIFIILGSSYPFAPISMTVIGCLTIGMPSFFLAMEPNDKPVGDDFFSSVMRATVPTAVLIGLFVGFFGVLEKIGYLADATTLSFYVTAYFSFFHLMQTSLPISNWKLTVVGVMLILFFASLFVPDLLPLSGLSGSDYIFMGATMLLGTVLLCWCHKDS
ncbi:MAG: HAD-IC family P-type ATPase [Clostridia bacterium]|nr:HAD-IC family P-type ATPase [Clostridia bacterium]